MGRPRFLLYQPQLHYFLLCPLRESHTFFQHGSPQVSLLYWPHELSSLAHPSSGGCGAGTAHLVSICHCGRSQSRGKGLRLGEATAVLRKLPVPSGPPCPITQAYQCSHMCSPDVGSLGTISATRKQGAQLRWDDLGHPRLSQDSTCFVLTFYLLFCVRVTQDLLCTWCCTVSHIFSLLSL